MAMQSPRDVRDARARMRDQGGTSVSSVSCLRSFLYFRLALMKSFVKYVLRRPASENYPLPRQRAGIVSLPNAQFCFVFSA